MSATATIVYDHAFTIAFSLHSPEEDGCNIPAAALRIAILTRLASLTDDELLEAVGAPFDSYSLDQTAQARGAEP